MDLKIYGIWKYGIYIYYKVYGIWKYGIYIYIIQCMEFGSMVQVCVKMCVYAYAYVCICMYVDVSLL
jgi:hypothetical protein